MLVKAQSYKGLICSLKRTMPDSTLVYRTIWENIAVPLIMYGGEAIPVSEKTVSSLDQIQATLAKIILGTPPSTVNSVAQLEFGLRTFKHRIAFQKIKFILKVRNGEEGCEATKECVERAAEINKL